MNVSRQKESQDTEFGGNAEAQGGNDPIAVVLLEDAPALALESLASIFCNGPCYRHLGCVIENRHIPKEGNHQCLFRAKASERHSFCSVSPIVSMKSSLACMN
jgi:hypothetical protein